MLIDKQIKLYFYYSGSCHVPPLMYCTSEHAHQSERLNYKITNIFRNYKKNYYEIYVLAENLAQQRFGTIRYFLFSNIFTHSSNLNKPHILKNTYPIPLYFILCNYEHP